MTPEEREHSSLLVYQLLPSRYGMNPDDLRRADAIEIVVGQGAKPGGGGMLLGQKLSERVAAMRDLPVGIDQRSACRHPDWTGPDDLEIKIEELREITDWEKPIFVKIGASRAYYDVALAVKAGADVVVLDGMQGGTAATQEVFIEHVGIPLLAAIPPAVQALKELGVHRRVQLIVSGGIRSGADVAKALALGADAVSIGTAALIALGDNAPELEDEYAALGTAPGFYDDWHEGRDPAGISTQDAGLAARLDPELGGRRLANYLRVLTLETQTLARACGKSHVHNLEPEDLVALTSKQLPWRACRSPAPAGFRAPASSPRTMSFLLRVPQLRRARGEPTSASAARSRVARAALSASVSSAPTTTSAATSPACNASGGCTVPAVARGSSPSATRARTRCCGPAPPRTRRRRSSARRRRIAPRTAGDQRRRRG